MVIETENRKAHALLPPGLVDSAVADAIFADPTPAVLLEADGRTPLWSSHEAARKLGYRDAHALLRSRLPHTAPGTHRLAELAAQPDATSAARMEKLRFFIGFRGIALTAVCRLLTLRNGKRALLVSLPRNPGDVSDPHSFGSLQHGVSDITTEAMLRANLLHPLVPDDAQGATSPALPLPDAAEHASIADAGEAAATHTSFEDGEDSCEDTQDVAEQDTPHALSPANHTLTDTSDGALAPIDDDLDPASAARGAPLIAAHEMAFSHDETVNADPHDNDAVEPVHNEPTLLGPLWLHQPVEARKPRRFIFALDQDGLVQSISPPLADSLGDENAIRIGEHLGAVIARHNAEAGEKVTQAIAEGETWTGISLLWPVAETLYQMPVEFNALPVIDAQNGLTGYSGFGRCRLDAAEEHVPDVPEVSVPEVGDIVVPEVLPPLPLADFDDLTDETAQGANDDAAEADVTAPSLNAQADSAEERHEAADAFDADETTDAVEHHDDAEPTPITLKTAVTEISAEDDEIGDEDEADDASTLHEAHGLHTSPDPQDTSDLENTPILNNDDAMPAPPDHQELARQLAALSRPASTQLTQKPAETPNVVSIRTGQPTHAMPGFQRHGLSMSERNAFREIAKALGARFEDGAEAGEHPGHEPDINAPDAGEPTPLSPLAARIMEGRRADTAHAEQDVTPFHVTAGEADAATPLLDRLPIGILVLKGDTPLFANRTLLDLTGYTDFKTFFEEDGARAIFRKSSQPRDDRAGFDTIVLTTREGEMMPVDAHLQIVDWDGGKATLISMRRAVELEQGKALRSVALDLKRVRSEAGELRAILDTATDGVITLDEKGIILSLNSAAEALFGLNQNEIVGDSFTRLLINESHADALDYLEGLRNNGLRSVLNDGREVFGREKKGGRIPLFMTLGRISDDEPQRFCAVLRDLTAQKRVESELTDARRTAELASAKKSDFLAKISHEIRTPMNAIMGFAEVMQEERLGPLGNAKYKEYLGDIRTSGQHVVSLVNDLLDLAKIEAGRMEMNFAATDVNAIVSSCVGIIQPQANANRVLVRTQLAQKLPPVVADERSIRQIVLNMLSNATRFTESGGQVIVATALLESGEAVIRIRDTGIGMTPTEIEQALEPFRQVGTQRNKGGTGLGLPLTKALVEANRASFNIRSAPGEGTMIEITFPSTRVLAE